MTSPARDADIDGLLWSFARDCVDKGTQFSDPSTTYEEQSAKLDGLARDLARTACSAERLRSLLDARNATPAAPALEGARDATGVLRTEEAPSERPDETLGLAQAIREMHTVAEESPAAFDCCAMCHEEWPCNAVSLAWAILDRAASSSSVREAPSEPSALQRDASERPTGDLLLAEVLRLAKTFDLPCAEVAWDAEHQHWDVDWMRDRSQTVSVTVEQGHVYWAALLGEESRNGSSQKDPDTFAKITAALHDLAYLPATRPAGNEGERRG